MDFNDSYRSKELVTSASSRLFDTERQIATNLMLDGCTEAQ
jgi:ATP-dependent Clp protease adapter protein ClpS